MLWQICLVLLGTYALFVRWKNREYNKISKLFPSKMKQVPILKHAVNFLGNSADRMRAIKKMGEEAIYDYNGIVSLWLGYKFIVVLADPEAAEVVMKTCLEKDEMMYVSRELVGNGSIFAPVSIWRPRRKFLAPTFGQKTLNSFVKIFSKQATILTEQLKFAAEHGEFSLFEKVTKYSMDSVCETVLGSEVNSQIIPNHPVPESFGQFCDLAADRMVKPWLYLDSIYKWHWDYKKFESAANIVKQYVSKIVESKRMNMNEQKNNILDKEKECNAKLDQELTKPKSFLEILIESGGDKGFTNLELQEETIVMLTAGTDTSSVAVSFTSLLLAKYPHIQDKVYEEIKEVIGDTERRIEPNDLPKLKYLEAVVKESLRLYPPVPLVIRNADKDVTLPSGETLVAGVGAVIHIWAIHRNPKYWGPDAKVFRPERFLEGPLKHPYAFMPFSCGPRNCLGYQYAMMSIKTVMSHIIRRYRILSATVPDGVSEADGELPVTFEVMMKHVGNFKLQLKSRN